MEQIIKESDEHHLQPFNFGLNHHIVSSKTSSAASSSSCHIFFNPTQDHTAFYHPQLYHQHPRDDYYGYERGSSYEIEKKVENGLKLTLWKKEDEDQGPAAQNILVEDHKVKWLPPKKKIKRRDQETNEVKKVKPSSSSSEETDLSSNSSLLSYNCNTPIRVCSDCHTTKTPLWRSGPKGPKSLCNACGIRQRKARRAVAAAAAAAAAAANGGGGTSSSSPMKMKEEMGKSVLKKRCKVRSSGGGSSTTSTSSNGKKKKKNKIGFEDFLINLSNKLALINHRVFPQDEKEAAILLMALSSGLVHG